MKNKKTLASFIDKLQGQSKYWFTKEEGIIGSGLQQRSFINAACRLAKEHRIALIAKGFYIIVPLEHNARGIIPSSWYIDAFMQHLQQKYYVGLLMAASMHGASHQQPQVFQVVVDKQLRIKKSKINLSFLVKKNLSCTPIEKFKTYTGYFNISTKEATALDLVQYNHLCGYWNNVATILAELSGTLDAKLLLQAATNGKYAMPTIQRLGYLLDFIGIGEKGHFLQEYIASNKPQTVLLTPEYAKANAALNKKWHLLINDQIEVDNI